MLDPAKSGRTQQKHPQQRLPVFSYINPGSIQLPLPQRRRQLKRLLLIPAVKEKDIIPHRLTLKISQRTLIAQTGGNLEVCRTPRKYSAISRCIFVRISGSE